MDVEDGTLIAWIYPSDAAALRGNRVGAQTPIGPPVPLSPSEPRCVVLLWCTLLDTRGRSAAVFPAESRVKGSLRCHALRTPALRPRLPSFLIKVSSYRSTPSPSSPFTPPRLVSRTYHPLLPSRPSTHSGTPQQDSKKTQETMSAESNHSAQKYDEEKGVDPAGVQADVVPVHASNDGVKREGGVIGKVSSDFSLAREEGSSDGDPL
jgi:hypothetical protein